MYLFLGFGVLLIFRAASTESAPRQFYPELAEEDIIDGLAELTSGRGIDPGDLDYARSLYYFSNRNRPNSFGEERLNPKVTHKAPLRREFGYKPSDPRFYLPIEDLSRESTDTEQSQNLKEDSDHNRLDRDESASAPYMKKSSQNDLLADTRDTGGAELELSPHMSHVMTSSHAVDHAGPSYFSQLPDQSPSSIFIVLVAAGSAMGVVVLIGAGVCVYRINERIKATADVDYPAYGVTGPSKDVSPTVGDRKLAQSAHMYHYQHQKQQMAALQKSPLAGDGPGSAGSDVESEDENDEGDYTVYECPGLAPAGDMEVKNPLYQDEPTPATPQTVKCEDDPGSRETTGK